MALITAPELVVGKLIGETPSSGIVYGLQAAGTLAAVLAYDESTDRAVIPRALAATGGALIGGTTSLRIESAQGTPAGAAGAGLELHRNSGAGYITAYDRSANALVPLELASSALRLSVGGGVRATLATDTMGLSGGVSLSIGGAAAFDRSGNYTRMLDADGGVIIEGGGAATGWRRILAGDLIEVYDRGLGLTYMQINPGAGIDATSTALYLAVNATMRRVKIKAGNALTGADTVLVLG